MANYANLKSDIAGVIRTNNNEEITGDILQEQLLGMVDSLGAGFQYKGVATPATAPGTPDENVFYIASTAGTYTNFGGLVVAEGEVAILKYNGSWAKEVTGAATAAQVTQLGQKAVEFVPESVDLSSFKKLNYSIKTDGTYGTSTTYKHIRVPINGEENIVVTAGASNEARIAFLANDNAPTSGGTIAVVSGTSVVAIPASTVKAFRIPSGTVLVAIYAGSASEYAFMPSSVTLGRFVIDDLQSTSTKNALSARQGKLLGERMSAAEAKVETLEDTVENLTEDRDETIYENEGQVAYYEQNGSYFGWRGSATYVPALPTDSVINRIVFPPFRGRFAAGGDAVFLICYGDLTTTIVPNSLTRISEGTIENVYNSAIIGYTVELDNPVTIPSGKSIFIFIYGNNLQQIYFLGGGATATELSPYSNDDAVVFYYSSDTATPFSQTWSRASAGASARYRVCNPSLRIYEKAVIPSVVDDILPDKVEEILTERDNVNVYLPNKIYAVVGDTLQLFFQGIVGVVNISDYDIYAECSKGKTFPRYFSYTPVVEDVGTTTLTVYVRDRKGTILGQASCDLVTVSAPSSPVSAKSIFTFGDSLTSQGQWPGEAKRRLVGNSTYDSITGKGLSNLAFYGYMNKTINEQPVDYFGVGGWTWSNYLTKGTGGAFRFYITGVSSLSIGAKYTNNGFTYTIQEINVTGDSGNIRCTTSANTNTPSASGTLTKTSGDGDATITFASYETENANPLWDDTNNKVSFIPYVQACGANTIDAVYVLLSWNGQGSWKEYSVNDATGHIADAKTFARTLHTEYPNAKLFIMGLQMPSETGGLGYNYGASGGLIDGQGVKQTAFNYNKALQDLCNLDEFSPYCEFVAVAPQFDSLYNMPSYNTKVNIRNTITEKVGSNGVHPSNSGYFQIADAVYRSIVANFCQ